MRDLDCLFSLLCDHSVMEVLFLMSILLAEFVVQLALDALCGFVYHAAFQTAACAQLLLLLATRRAVPNPKQVCTDWPVRPRVFRNTAA